MFKLKSYFQNRRTLDKIDLKHKVKRLMLVFNQLTKEEFRELVMRLAQGEVPFEPLRYSVEINVEMQRILQAIICKNGMDKQAVSNRKPDRMLLNLKLIWLQLRLEEEVYAMLANKPDLVGNSVLYYLK